jgi:hypothetical protein
MRRINVILSALMGIGLAIGLSSCPLVEAGPLEIQGAVTTLAGSTTLGADDDTGAKATFRNPTGITTDGTRLFIADTANNEIREITIATGAVKTLAGSTTPGYAEGTGANASFTLPIGICTDGTTLYVADSGNNVIRTVAISTGEVGTLAGSGKAAMKDGAGTEAAFSAPNGICIYGPNLYVADAGNHQIRKIEIASQTVSTLAGYGKHGYKDATGTNALFYEPKGICTDGSSVYVGDTSNNLIRKIVIATGVVTTLAGTTTAGYAEGTGTAASFEYPTGMFTDGTTLYVSDTNNNAIRKIVIATAEVTTLAGSATAGHTDGTGSTASFTNPVGICSDGSSLYVTDYGNSMIRVVK